MNRTAAAKALYGTLNPSVGPLQSLVRLKGEAGYRSDFAKWNYSLAKVDTLMKTTTAQRAATVSIV